MVPKALVFRFVLLATVISFVACSSSKDDFPPRPKNWTAPYTRITLLDGEYLPLSAYSSKPTIVMFWASWCSASRSTIDDYSELAKKYNAVNFLAVSLDSSNDENRLRKFITKENLENLTHAYSGNKFQDEAVVAFRVDKIPYFYLINTQEQVVYEGNDLDDLEEGLTKLHSFAGNF